MSKWPQHRIDLATCLRIWAAEDLDIYMLLRSVNGSVAIFKSDVDECKTEDDLLDMLYARLDTVQPRI